MSASQFKTDMSTKPGRNDPCHCGSGKKYKNCHLPLEHHENPAPTPVSTPLSAPAADSSPPPENLNPAALREMARKLRDSGAPEAKKLVFRTEAIADFIEQQSEIDAATAALESHAEEFSKVLADEKAATGLAKQVFADECFAPLRFSADDVGRAFAQVGGAPNLADSADTVDKLRRAILFLADKERRTLMAMKLACQVPVHTKAGRFMEAWMVRYCGQSTSSAPEQTNLFLFEMFTYGYDRWIANKVKGGSTASLN